MNLNAWMVWRRDFRRIPVLLTAEWWSYPMSGGIMENIDCQSSFDIIILSIIWRMVYWIYASMTSCSYCRHCEHWPLYLCILRPVSLPFIRDCEMLCFSKIMHDRRFPVLYKHSLKQETFSCCPGQNVPLICHQLKTSCQWLLSDRLVTIRQSLRRWNVVSGWICMGSYTCTCPPISAWRNAQELSAIIVTKNDCSDFWFLRIYASKFLEKLNHLWFQV